MNTVINRPETTLRKVTGLDFGYIRQLPVQLTHPSAGALQLKQLRMMMQVSDHALLLAEQDDRVTAFLAWQYLKPCLLIKHLAIDRFALNNGLAAEMEQQAVACAKQQGCAAVIVRAAQLNSSALQFYRELGYRLDGHTLIKDL